MEGAKVSIPHSGGKHANAVTFIPKYAVAMSLFFSIQWTLKYSCMPCSLNMIRSYIASVAAFDKFNSILRADDLNAPEIISCQTAHSR